MMISVCIILFCFIIALLIDFKNGDTLFEKKRNYGRHAKH